MKLRPHSQHGVVILDLFLDIGRLQKLHNTKSDDSQTTEKHALYSYTTLNYSTNVQRKSTEIPQITATNNVSGNSPTFPRSMGPRLTQQTNTKHMTLLHE